MSELVATESMKVIATCFFIGAVLHTFAVKKIIGLANRFEAGSVPENLFHFLGEIEVIFGVWAALLVAVWSFRFGSNSAVFFMDNLNFAEPAFVFVIMCMAATRPVISLAKWLIDLLVKFIPLPNYAALYIVTLIVGPILGSLITEPAAMTLTALLLKENFFENSMSDRFKYATIGLLFVSVSLGGTFTHFAAPPVLMVASPWGWDTPFMLINFGWRALIVIIVSVIGTAIFFRKELMESELGSQPKPDRREARMTLWISVSHLFFMGLTIFYSHHMSFFIPVFLFFLGWCAVTKEFQDELKIKESLLVGFFLGGLVVLGNLQGWWLQPLLANLGDLPLYFGAITLTAVTDNAALTYLGTLVPTLTDSAKYMLVSGAVVGGGLTVIANAPNPAGYGILQSSFGIDGISPLYLFLGALPYTVLGAVVFAL
jgi:Na+/H+ antiporter NhaD/arsenite permease-like protein